MHFAIGTRAFAHPKTYSSLLPLLEHLTTLHALEITLKICACHTANHAKQCSSEFFQPH
jgi:hypothetical protein